MVYANFSSNLPTGLHNFEFVDLTKIADGVKGSKFILRCVRPIRMKIYSSLHYFGINVLTSQIICMKSDTV